MAEKAKITSVEALEAFRANLVVYMAKARPALEEVSSDVMRMRLWLEDDRTNYWQAQVKKRQRVLEQAQQALFSARMSNLNEGTSSAQFDLHRAKRALDEAAERLKKVKAWDKKFEGLANPWLRQMEKLHSVLSHDMPVAIAHLSETIRLLSDYAELGVSGRAVSSAASDSSSESTASSESPAETEADTSTTSSAPAPSPSLAGEPPSPAASETSTEPGASTSNELRS